MKESQNLAKKIPDKHCKTGIVLHMPTVHFVLLQTVRTVLLDARNAPTILSLFHA